MKVDVKKKIVLAALVGLVAGAGVMGVTSVSAQTVVNSDPMSSLVQKIAQRFNLNQTEVQAVFDEAHKERHAEMKAMHEERLSQLVSEGKITEEQKSKILAKMGELYSQKEANRAEMQNLSPEERRAKKAEKRAELEKWAQDNGIDLQYLNVMKGRGYGGPEMKSMPLPPNAQ